MPKKKYCLEKGQLQNIVDAARADPDDPEPGVCEKALEFVDKELGMGKKQKGKSKSQGTNFVDRVISRKVRKAVDSILDGF